MKYGNFSTTDPAFGVGSVVEFTCEPGYTLEQGAVILECVNEENPQWNETEPACRGDFVCVMFGLTCTLVLIDSFLAMKVNGLKCFFVVVVVVMLRGDKKGVTGLKQRQ